MANAETHLLGTFQKHIEDMRALTQCKICIKPFYEPFILACGHTYCYSCLSNWFCSPHNRGKPKNCPDCRSIVRAEPSPNYLLRDMVHMFINRAELLPEDETVQEHLQAKEEESKLLADDRVRPGLFKGIFRRDANLRRRGRFYPRDAREATDAIDMFHTPIDSTAIRDTEDGVMRCPHCMWELEDGECNRCGWGQHSDTDGDTISSSDSAEVDYRNLDSEDDEERHLQEHPSLENIGNLLTFDPINDARNDSDDSVSDEDDEDLDSFINDDDDEDESEDEDDDENDLPDEVDNDDDDESVQTVTDYPHTFRDERFFEALNGYIHGNDDVAGRTVPRRSRVVMEDETEDGSSVSADSSSTDSNNDDSTTADDDSSIREITPPPNTTRTSRRRRIIDSDDSSDDNDSDKAETTEIRPPQNSAVRRQRLHQRRANGQTHNQRQQQNPHVIIPNHGQPGGGYGAGRGIQTARRSRPYITRVY